MAKNAVSNLSPEKKAGGGGVKHFGKVLRMVPGEHEDRDKESRGKGLAEGFWDVYNDCDHCWYEKLTDG